MKLLFCDKKILRALTRTATWWVLGYLAIVLVMLAPSAHAAPALAGASLRTTATATYIPYGYTQTEVATSNAVTAIVATVEAVVLEQSQTLTRPPGAQMVISHFLANTGNVASSYSLNLINRGPGCPASTLDMGSLRLLRDVNNNGASDAADNFLPLNTAGALALAPGQRVSLLVLGSLPAVASGQACTSLVVTTALQGASAGNHDVVVVSSGAALALTKTATYPGNLIAGQSRIDFGVVAVNVGSAEARPSSALAGAVTSLMVDGAVASLVLVRDVLPAGTRYVPGSLQSSSGGAIRLYRRANDPAFSYRTADDADAAEVAVGIASPVPVGASAAMQFAVTVQPTQEGDIRNIADGLYHDGTAPVVSPSNPVWVTSSRARIGIAKHASNPVAHAGTGGQPDGTATVRFTIRLRNYGSAWLHASQVSDLLEGAADDRFGAYTASAVPGAKQYTVVPGSLTVVSGSGVVIDPDFNGTASAQNLLAAGSRIAPGADVSLRFDVRVNLSGRATSLVNMAKAAAATAEGAVASVFDDSMDGSDPDPDADGNPNNNSSPTLVAPQVPMLALANMASLPRRLAPGEYEIDYTLRVSNGGSAPASNVRVIDNLECAFGRQLTEDAFSSWELVGRPRARNGLLTVSPAFTGKAVCKRQPIDGADPADRPDDLSLSLVDGSRSLAAGQSEEISFTVRVRRNPQAAAARVKVDNKAWAAAFTANTVVIDPASVLAAAATTAQSLFMDPQGIVYNAVTRQPVAGAVVTYTRLACNDGVAGPIGAAELFGGTSGGYSFEGNGGVSMTTGADGAYQFSLISPPVRSVCTYAVSVTPPAGSAYVAPSTLLPAATGVYASCGAVVDAPGAPAEGDSTVHYSTVALGFNGPAGKACDVSRNHIPLDPGSVTGLVLRMEGSKRVAELGDFVDFALTVTNRSGSRLVGFELQDTLPIGFAYLPGSAQLDGVATDNPAGGAGPQLAFRFPVTSLAVDASTTLRYRARIGVGAPATGESVNRATAQAGALQSNQASWRVRISGGAFSDEAFAFGKVYLDCDRDGLQREADEPGVPGVRLFLENGTSVVTDADGKWSLYGLRPITHVLRLDQSTLPAGARLMSLDNRNSGNPASRFVDLSKGEFHKADFVIENCGDKAMLAEVAERRSTIKSKPNAEGEAQVRVRLDPEGVSPVLGDTRSLPASGQAVAGGGFAGSFSPPAAPLIALPAAAVGGSGNRFVGAGGVSGGTLGAMAGAPAPVGSLFTPISALADGARPSPITGSSATAPGTGDTRPAATSGAMLQPRAHPVLPSAAAALVELETLLTARSDNQLGFLGLADGDTLPSQSGNVRVKGDAGGGFRLTVNGQVVDEKRVGKKATLDERKILAWEYIGVLFKPGRNALQLESIDSFGNARGTAQTIHLIAPDRLGAIRIEAPRTASADQRTPVAVRVTLADGAGIPVTARTQLTLESDRGRWLDEDLNPGERGVQVFMEQGQAEFRLIPPAEPGVMRVRVSAGDFVAEATIALVPELRPMIGVGVLEGVLDLTSRGQLSLGAVPAGAAFENELSSLGSENSGHRASARAAFFLKGAIKGEYLLTSSFDSTKRQKDRLFRDIRPDEFYPVYGDSSLRGFDAQSTQRLYVRIDKNRSYLLYGDFTTASSAEVRSLSQSNRTLTGARHVYDDERLRVSSYMSNTSQTQQVEEFRALGTSGPYYLSATGGMFVDNSEQIEIIVRDRNQPAVVLQRTPVTRFVDYTVESLTRRILFTRPISSVDANLNPQSIRVTYEVDSGGAKFVVAGTDAQFKVADTVQLGVVANTDRNPANQRDLAAVTALARLGDRTTMAAELVRTRSDEKHEGSGARIEVRMQDEKLAAVGTASRTSTGFDNPGASTSAGRTDVSTRAEYRIDPTLAVRGEALYSKDAVSRIDRSGVTLSVQKKLGESVVVEGGIRHGQSNTTLGSSSGFDYGTASTYSGGLGSSLGAGNTTALGASATASANQAYNDLTTLRARVSAAVPGLPAAQAFVEAEQSVDRFDRRTVAIGANYALTEKTRVYGRYELISRLYGPLEAGSTFAPTTGIVGIESAYMEGGRVYNEYRLSDSVDGRGVMAALGLRNTYQLTERVRVTGGVEHTRNLRSASNSVNNATGFSGALGESTAVTAGVEYSVERLRTSAILEARNGSDAHTLLFSGGAGYQLSPDLSLLARSVVSESTGQGSNAGNERALQRHQVGLALRPVGSNVWNALARYEHRVDRVLGSGTSAGSAFGSGLAGSASGNVSLPGRYTTDIVATHLNVNPVRGTYITARYAVKLSRMEDSIVRSRYWAQLMQGRVTRDLGSDWDIGLQAGLLNGQGGALQKTLGLELGYQVYRDVWASVGYNFVGLTDRDLAANEYTSKGGYMRVRMKFDETALGFRPVEAAATADASGGSVSGAAAAGGVVPPASEIRQPDAPELGLSDSLSMRAAVGAPEPVRADGARKEDARR